MEKLNPIRKALPALLALVLIVPAAALQPPQAEAEGLSAGTTSTQVVKVAKAKKHKKHKRIAIKKAVAATVSDRVYTGKEIKPAVKLKYKRRKLKAGRDYTLSYESNVKAGNAKIIVRGNGRFKGARVICFKIEKADIAKVKIAKIKSYYTTGLSAIKPVPEVSRFGEPLKAKRDYKVSYSDNVMPGRATVTIKGKGNYTGSRTIKFKLVNRGDVLARMACKLSYSHEKLAKNGYKGTKAYLEAYKTHKAKGVWTPISCSVGMHIAIRAAKIDCNFKINTEQDCKYLNFWSETPGNDKWTCLGDYVNGMELLPGDILLGDKKKKVNHIFMYVGENIAKRVYKSDLVDTDADFGEPTGAWVSSHARYRGGAAMCISEYKFASSGSKHYRVFRCTNPDRGM